MMTPGTMDDIRRENLPPISRREAIRFWAPIAVAYVLVFIAMGYIWQRWFA